VFVPESAWSAGCSQAMPIQILPVIHPKSHILFGDREKLFFSRKAPAGRKVLTASALKGRFRLENTYLIAYKDNYNELASF